MGLTIAGTGSFAHYLNHAQPFVAEKVDILRRYKELESKREYEREVLERRKEAQAKYFNSGKQE